MFYGANWRCKNVPQLIVCTSHQEGKMDQTFYFYIGSLWSIQGIKSKNINCEPPKYENNLNHN